MKINTAASWFARLVIVFGLTACANVNTLTPVPVTGNSPAQPTFSSTATLSEYSAGVTASPSNTSPTTKIVIPVTAGTATPAPASQLPPQYISPVENADYVSKNTTIAIRYGPQLNQQNLAGLNISAKGDASGAHTGQTVLADDQKTIIFKPDQPFIPGEQVQVSVGALNLDAQTSFTSFEYSFNVAVNQKPGGVGAATQSNNQPPASAFPNYLTVPQDIPHFTVSTNSGGTTNEGYIFVAPIPWTSAITGDYLLILDGNGQLVYYQSMASALNAFDFKVQPNGRLSYFSQKDTAFYVMDSHYKVIDTYKAGNGYTTDLHDLQLLPNGNALLMAYDAETIDMSKIVAGGNPNATVTGLIVQELDPSRNVIFQWRSWDHVAFSDTTATLTDPNIDLVHGNALALANDGNLLVSNRNLSEITKIDLQTGAVLWRLGGKANQFTFVNDQPFAFQHDIRQLPNGDITLFDNQGTEQNPTTSKGVEYRVDEANKTVTKVWEYQPQIFGTFMGNTERLPDGNTFLDWGAPFRSSDYQYVTMTEVDANGQVIFQLAFDQPYVSYRAFLSPWQATPAAAPALAFKNDGGALTLGYSWNGATDVASWNVYGGTSPKSLNLIETKAKNGFETQSQLKNLSKNECFFQVAPLDKNGNEMARSSVVSTDPALCP